MILRSMTLPKCQCTANIRPETVWLLPTRQSRSSEPAATEAFGHMMQPTIFALQHILPTHHCNETECLQVLIISDNNLKTIY